MISMPCSYQAFSGRYHLELLIADEADFVGPARGRAAIAIEFVAPDEFPIALRKQRPRQQKRED